MARRPFDFPIGRNGETLPPARRVAKGREASKALYRERERRHRTPDIDVRRVRLLIRMSQVLFAQLFGIPTATLRHWEAGERRPSGAARTLLHVIANQPAAVRRALKCRVFHNDERHLLPGVSFDEQEIRLRILREEDESKPPDGQT